MPEYPHRRGSRANDGRKHPESSPSCAPVNQGKSMRLMLCDSGTTLTCSPQHSSVPLPVWPITPVAWLCKAHQIRSMIAVWHLILLHTCALYRLTIHNSRATTKWLLEADRLLQPNRLLATKRSLTSHQQKCTRCTSSPGQQFLSVAQCARPLKTHLATRRPSNVCSARLSPLWQLCTEAQSWC